MYNGDQWHKHNLGLSMNQTLITARCEPMVQVLFASLSVDAILLNIIYRVKIYESKKTWKITANSNFISYRVGAVVLRLVPGNIIYYHGTASDFEPGSRQSVRIF
jgi:hypothetical protein